MRALVLMHDSAQPAISGPRVRSRYLWPALARFGWDVRILGLDPAGKPDQALGPPGIEATYLSARRQSLPLRVLNACLYSYHQWPYAPQLANKVDETAKAWRPEVIHADDLRMAAYLPVIRGMKCPSLQTMTLHNVETDLIRVTGSAAVPIARSVVNRIHRLTLGAYEGRAVRAVDTAFAYSQTDLARYRQLYPDAMLATTSNGANASEIVPAYDPGSPSVFILGSLSYVPNIEGLRWFLREVRPKLCPNVKITVAGSRATAQVRQMLEIERLLFVDTPADLAPLYAAHGLSVIPLLSGSGTRGRVLEALAHERMVITTTKGVEGLEDLVGHGVIVKDEPAAFASAVNYWSSDSNARVDQARLGRRAVLERYDWTCVAEKLAENWRTSVQSNAGNDAGKAAGGASYESRF